MIYPASYFMESLKASLPIRAQQHELFKTVLAGGPQKWAAIRKIYKLQEQFGYSPYFLDWGQIFTRIESDAWHYIRTMGLRMYPQYPVGRFFVDFGDPETQIAIECDGRQYHDAEKDAERDRICKSLGWRVFRFTGSALVKGEDEEGSAKDGFLDIAALSYRRDEYEDDQE